MLYRGDVMAKDFNVTIAIIMTVRRLVPNWLQGRHQPTKNVVARVDLVKLQRAMCMLSNNTAIVKALACLDHKFDLMFAKHAFVHR